MAHNLEAVQPLGQQKSQRNAFPALIMQLWQTALKTEHLQAGFRAAGLMPFNPEAMKSAQLVPSHVASTASPSVVTIGEVS